jgi:hypothetical protein
MYQILNCIVKKVSYVMSSVSTIVPKTFDFKILESFLPVPFKKLSFSDILGLFPRGLINRKEVPKTSFFVFPGSQYRGITKKSPSKPTPPNSPSKEILHAARLTWLDEPGNDQLEELSAADYITAIKQTTFLLSNRDKAWRKRMNLPKINTPPSSTHTDPIFPVNSPPCTPPSSPNTFEHGPGNKFTTRVLNLLQHPYLHERLPRNYKPPTSTISHDPDTINPSNQPRCPSDNTEDTYGMKDCEIVHLP